MNLRTLKTSLLALAGSALIATSAQAAAVTYNDGDLFIGFVNGGTNDYLIDVGQASQFYNVTGTITLTGLGNTNADLTAIFGAGWYGSSTVKWSAGGTTDFGTDSTNGSDTVYATSTSSTPYSDAFVLSTPNSALDTIGSNFNTVSTTNSTVATNQTASNGASWASYESTANGGTGANSPSGSLNYFTPSIEGTTSQGIYLSQLTEGDSSAGKELGSFTITSGGAITFTGVSAAPEPSTYALLIAGVILLAFARFKFRVKAS